MAKVISNHILAGLSGRLGRQLVIRHMRDGRTIVLTRPDFSNRVFSKGQTSHQSRFKRAAAYARLASKTVPIYKQFAAGTSKNAYNLALSDWFKPPVIHEVTRQADYIRIHATDNIQVARVRITLSGEHGQTLEQGEAVQQADASWHYETLTEGKLLVEAFDLAGNVTTCHA